MVCQLLAAKSTYPPLVSYDSHLSSFLSYWVTREGDEVEVDRSIWYFFFKVHRRTPLIYHLPAGIGFFEKFGEGCSSFLFSFFFFLFSVSSRRNLRFDDTISEGYYNFLPRILVSYRKSDLNISHNPPLSHLPSAGCSENGRSMWPLFQMAEPTCTERERETETECGEKKG